MAIDTLQIPAYDRKVKIVSLSCDIPADGDLAMPAYDRECKLVALRLQAALDGDLSVRLHDRNAAVVAAFAEPYPKLDSFSGAEEKNGIKYVWRYYGDSATPVGSGTGVKIISNHARFSTDPSDPLAHLIYEGAVVNNFLDPWDHAGEFDEYCTAWAKYGAVFSRPVYFKFEAIKIVDGFVTLDIINPPDYPWARSNPLTCFATNQQLWLDDDWSYCTRTFPEYNPGHHPNFQGVRISADLSFQITNTFLEVGICHVAGVPIASAYIELGIDEEEEPQWRLRLWYDGVFEKTGDWQAGFPPQEPLRFLWARHGVDSIFATYAGEQETIFIAPGIGEWQSYPFVRAGPSDFDPTIQNFYYERIA